MAITGDLIMNVELSTSCVLYLLSTSLSDIHARAPLRIANIRPKKTSEMELIQIESPELSAVTLSRLA